MSATRGSWDTTFRFKVVLSSSEAVCFEGYRELIVWKDDEKCRGGFDVKVTVPNEIIDKMKYNDFVTELKSKIKTAYKAQIVEDI